MKKFTLMLSAALVSLSVLAAPIERASFSAKTQLVKQEVSAQKAPMSTENLVAFKAAETNASAAKPFDVRKVAKKVDAATSQVTISEVGYGRAKANITPADGADALYYQIAILTESREMVAVLGYFPINTLQTYFSDTYQILRYAPDYGQRADGYTTSLPKGKYIYMFMGYPLTSDGKSVDTSGNPADYAAVPFEITLDGSEYAIKNVNVEVGANNQLTVTWENAAAVLPEGAQYEVRLYSLPSNDVIGDSQEELQQSTTWSTADTIEIADNSSYEVYINLWSAAGYNLGFPGDKFFAVGKDANAVTELAVSVDEETMKAIFTWKNAFASGYYKYSETDSSRVYNEVLIQDEKGNTFIFDNGYNNTSLETATSEALPVGKYTWQVMPFYVDNSWLYISVADGPAFEVKDVIAPVIDSIFVANTEETEVNLAVEVSDNAIEVTPADLVFDVTGDVTLTSAHLEADGTLKLTGLTAGSKYTIQVTATDPSGNKSTAYEFTFTAQADKIAPTNLKAELDSVSDKFVIINVEAEDNLATAEQLVYIFTFTDGPVIEKSTKDGQITIDGLTPETEYEVTVTVRDFGGNVSAESVKLQFTTLALIPIDLSDQLVLSQFVLNSGNEGAYNYELLLGGYNEGWARPYVYFDITTTREHIFSNIYTQADGNLDESYSGYQYIDAVTGKTVNLDITKVTLQIKYIDSEVEEGTTYKRYYIAADFLASDGNLYTFAGGFYPNLWVESVRTEIPEIFEDTDAPELWVSEDYPVEVEGTNVEIMFGAFDGPFWIQTGEIYTEIENLTLVVMDQEGTELASSAAGSIVNTPTLDEDGAYYFTASLTNLESNTDYTVYIVATDEAGNVSEPLAVQFTTGQGQGIEDINAEVKTSKALRNGVLIIERNGKEYNATGKLMK